MSQLARAFANAFTAPAASITPDTSTAIGGRRLRNALKAIRRGDVNHEDAMFAIHKYYRWIDGLEQKRPFLHRPEGAIIAPVNGIIVMALEEADLPKSPANNRIPNRKARHQAKWFDRQRLAEEKRERVIDQRIALHLPSQEIIPRRSERPLPLSKISVESLTDTDKLAIARQRYAGTKVLWKEFTKPELRTTVVVLFEGDDLRKAESFQVIIGAKASRQNNANWLLRKDASAGKMRQGGWVEETIEKFPGIMEILAADI